MQARHLGALALAAGLSLGAGAVQAAEADAVVTARDGTELGTVNVHDTPSGRVVVTVSLTGVPEGVHGIHLHETGDCSADDFTSAGGHIAGDAEHGVESEGGPHPGDLPNAIVQADGAIQLQHFKTDLDIEAHLLDEDGSAFIVHAGEDDYSSQPSGDAGDRIACGTFKQG